MQPLIKSLLLIVLFNTAYHVLNGQNIADPDTENVFLRFDKVKPLVEKWNKAISQHTTNDLDLLFADSIDCYTKRQGKTECIAGKNKWLEAHPQYKQQIGYLQLQHQDDDEKPTVIIAEFEKILTDNGKTDTVTAFLHFKKFNGQWKIFKESDMSSEINMARKKSVSSLKKGKYTFHHAYIKDYRNQGAVYDMATYDFNISIEIATKISGEYNCYSGGLRENTNYLIPEGKMENGILELTMIWNGFNEYTLEDYYNGNISADKKEIMHFKIVNGNELICLDQDGYIGGKSLKQVK